MFPGFVPPDPKKDATQYTPDRFQLEGHDAPPPAAPLPPVASDVLAHLGITGTEGLTGSQIANELRRGGRFVMFQYCVSMIFLTFRHNSGIYFLRAGQSASDYGSKYSMMSMFLGWWGIPWGPIWTIQALTTNTHGIDVTDAILGSLGIGGVGSLQTREPRRPRSSRTKSKKLRDRRDEDDYNIGS